MFGCIDFNYFVIIKEYISTTKYTRNKALRCSSPITLQKFVLRSWKGEFAFFSIWCFFHEYSRFTGQQEKGEAISLWLVLSVWLVSWFVFSTAKSLFTGNLRIVSVFAILTIAPVISESLLDNTRVTMGIL